jgi:phospholipase C
MVAALKGIELLDIRPYADFKTDLSTDFPYNYVFIEPKYAISNDYKGGTSQHPLDDIRNGEGLIKATYEAIRNSPIWETSLLIITWDEHGGFYDHVQPSSCPAPDASMLSSPHNVNDFTFKQYGPRVPAVIVSPWIPKGTIDHRTYDHSSVIKTLDELFKFGGLTDRDKKAAPLTTLLSLDVARTDALQTLPAPAGVTAADSVARAAAPAEAIAIDPTRATDTVDEGSLPVVVQSAMRQDLLKHPDQRAQIFARVESIKTRGDAAAYLAEVVAKQDVN